jgi:hypothetical protein
MPADDVSSPSTAQIACSCGVDGCRELGWPHEWDPIAAGDDCSVGGLGENPHRFATIIDGRIVSEPMGHKVAAPYVRWGSGYACEECVA